jgi:CubicO group peptidase (beta-lactamase class C family)
MSNRLQTGTPTFALQEAVQALLDELVADGDEVGLQAAVIKDGALVADAQSGLADPVTGEPVSAGTLFFAGSTAKGVLSSLVHVLVAAGTLDYDLRLAEVWPEFAAHGKGNVTVRHVLMHQAGVPGLPPDLTTEQLCDWDHMCALVAAAVPWWPAGSAFGYHAQTFGFLLGETLQRRTGARLAALLGETLSEPLAVTDELHFAVPARLLDRVARQVPPSGRPPPRPAPGSPLARALPPGAAPDAALANRRDVLTAQIPSFGTMSARAAARVYTALLGHVAGSRLLSSEQLAAAAAVAYSGRDEVMEMETSWSLGYSPGRPGAARSRPGSTFGMVGMNGSAAYADIDTGVAIALMRNRFTPDFTAIARLDDIVTHAYPPPANREDGGAR